MQYARALFLSGAFFNLVAGLLIIAATMIPDVGRLLGLYEIDPVSRTFLHVTAGAVLLFGWSYWLVGRDPVKNRPIIQLGVVGKLAIIAILWGHWLAGDIGVQLPVLTLADAVYAGLFWNYLRHSAAIS